MAQPKPKRSGSAEAYAAARRLQSILRVTTIVVAAVSSVSLPGPAWAQAGGDSAPIPGAPPPLNGQANSGNYGHSGSGSDSHEQPPVNGGSGGGATGPHVNPDPLGLYAALGVSPSATAQEIKKAYRKAALRFSPDKPYDAEARKAQETKFARLSHAYEVLSDPENRGAYDRTGADPTAQRKPTDLWSGFGFDFSFGGGGGGGGGAAAAGGFAAGAGEQVAAVWKWFHDLALSSKTQPQPPQQQVQQTDEPPQCDPSGHYAALEVAPDVTREMLRKAYRRKSVWLYGRSERHGEDVADRYRTLHAAWEVLGDDQRRAEYDRPCKQASDTAAASATAGAPAADPAAGEQTPSRRDDL